MKAITTQGWGLNPKLVLGDFDEPKPGPNDLLVEVRASSVNPKDWKLNYSLARALKPVIDSVFDFEHTDDAYARSKSGRARGKVVVKI